MNAIGYIRGSTSKQIVTCEAQEERIRKYCELQGMTIQAILSDSATTSKIPLDNRPGGSEIISAVKEKKVNAVIVTAIDRAFRNTSEALRWIDVFTKYGVGLHILNFGGSNLDTSSATGKMVFTFMAAVAEWERKIIAERTSAALQAMSANGELVTRPDRVRYGWMVSEDESTDKIVLKKNPKEQANIKRIIEMKASGIDPIEIARSLRKDGVKYRGHKLLVKHVRNIIKKDAIYSPIPSART
jgi:DNA invertase Pin-like site-specific DNA recombinase